MIASCFVHKSKTHNPSNGQRGLKKPVNIHMRKKNITPNTKYILLINQSTEQHESHDHSFLANANATTYTASVLLRRNKMPITGSSIRHWIHYQAKRHQTGKLSHDETIN